MPTQENRLLWWHPHLLPKHTAKASDSNAIDGYHPTVQIAVDQARLKQMIVVRYAVGVVVPVDEPHLGEIKNGRQHMIHWLGRLDVAEQNDGAGAMSLNSSDHMIELSMGVTAEEDHWSRLLCGNAARNSAN